METWRLITTWAADPAFNMGLDETLLESAHAPPTLRFYSWQPDTLSLGYFQRFADVRGIDGAGAVVRRLTGGGAIHHVNELTFSISVPRDHRLYRGPIAESYVRIHGAIAAALRELGVDPKLRGDEVLLSERPETGMCFHKSSPLDLVWDRRKGVGSAQRRGKARILHHGSIKLGPSPLEEEVATAASAGSPLACEAFAPILAVALAQGLAITLEAGVPTKAEREQATDFGARYRDPAFLKRR